MTEDLKETKRIETKRDVETYISRLKFAIDSGCVTIKFQNNRLSDAERNIEYTNEFTLNDLFPNEDPVNVLKRELATLSCDEYIETVKDTLYKKRTEMRVFGRQYSREVYIKIRVELLDTSPACVNNLVFVMSFHYAEYPFSSDKFPHRRSR